MRYKYGWFTVLFSLVVSLNCTETFTETGQVTLVAQISVDSDFISQGFFLVGDTVQFTGTVTTEEGGQTIPSSGLRYTSSNSSVVEINANTGRAVFKSVGGPVDVRVTFAEPELQGTTDTLEASTSVTVTEFEVELSLSSAVTGNPVDTLAALQGDVVAVDTARVFYEGDTVATVLAPDITIASSSNTAVADPGLPGEANQATLTGEGQAILTVELDQPDVPGTDPLAATFGIDVQSLLIELSVESRVAGSNHLANGDTLVTDSVQFSGIVITAGMDTTAISGATWTSSNGSVVNVKDAAAGIATLDAVGTSQVAVTFTDPDVPIQTDTIDVRVTTLVPSMTLESQYTAAVTDTLVTDSVWVLPAVTKDGQAQGGVTLLETESTDSSVVAIRDGPAGVIVFADTGVASIIMTVDQPDLPRAKIADTVDVEVTTYAVELTPLGSTPIMGDSIDYVVTVTDTRGDTTLTAPGVTFESTDSSVIEIVDGGTGEAFARDTGTATVSVTLDTPALPDPDSTLSDALAPTMITEERFYGTFSTLTGDFQDTVRVLASQVHKFTATTEVRFPNGTSGYVDSVSATLDTLWFVVGAGTNTGQLTLINLEDDLGGARDTVLTRDSFAGGGTVDDPYEPNDTFPLPDTAAVNISNALPFEALLSIDTLRTAPSDTNFFWLSTGNVDLNIRAETQQDANIDFFVCASTDPAPEPPTDYVSLCVRPKGDNDQGPDPRVEEEASLNLSTDVYVIGFYCVSGCTTAEPIVTYKVMIREN